MQTEAAVTTELRCWECERDGTTTRAHGERDGIIAQAPGHRATSTQRRARRHHGRGRGQHGRNGSESASWQKHTRRARRHHDRLGSPQGKRDGIKVEVQDSTAGEPTGVRAHCGRSPNGERDGTTTRARGQGSSQTPPVLAPSSMAYDLVAKRCKTSSTPTLSHRIARRRARCVHACEGNGKRGTGCAGTCKRMTKWTSGSSGIRPKRIMMLTRPSPTRGSSTSRTC